MNEESTPILNEVVEHVKRGLTAQEVSDEMSDEGSQLSREWQDFFLELERKLARIENYYGDI